MPHSNRAAGGGLGGGVCDVDLSLKKTSQMLMEIQGRLLTELEVGFCLWTLASMLCMLSFRNNYFSLHAVHFLKNWYVLK